VQRVTRVPTRGRDLVEVMEEHENLTWFIGDALCRKCAKRHGIWR
jgi:hypothetical protein